MMSVKKNLTIATLAALLAVPAFGATNANADTTPVASGSISNNQAMEPTSTWYKGNHPRGTTSAVMNRSTIMHPFNPYTDDADSISPQTTIIPNGAKVNVRHHLHMGPDGYEVEYNGHWYYSGSQDDTWLSKNEANSNLSYSQSSKNYNNFSNSRISGNTQYTNRNSLPQTGEINNQAKRIAASIILGAASIGAEATAIALKKPHSNAKINTYQETATSGNGHNHKISDIINELKTETNQLQTITNKIVNK